MFQPLFKLGNAASSCLTRLSLLSRFCVIFCFWVQVSTLLTVRQATTASQTPGAAARTGGKSDLPITRPGPGATHRSYSSLATATASELLSGSGSNATSASAESLPNFSADILEDAFRSRDDRSRAGRSGRDDGRSGDSSTHALSSDVQRQQQLRQEGGRDAGAGNGHGW